LLPILRMIICLSHALEHISLAMTDRFDPPSQAVGWRQSLQGTPAHTGAQQWSGLCSSGRDKGFGVGDNGNVNVLSPEQSGAAIEDSS